MFNQWRLLQIYCQTLRRLTVYVDSLYSTYLVVLIRLSYDDIGCFQQRGQMNEAVTSLFSEF